MHHSISLVLGTQKYNYAILSNIAEGYGRRSRREYVQFCSISYGSALELEAQLILSKKVKMCGAGEFVKSEKLLIEVLKMLRTMMAKLDLPKR